MNKKKEIKKIENKKNKKKLKNLWKKQLL